MPEIFSWGRFPRVIAEEVSPRTFSEVQNYVSHSTGVTPRGLGRSYGDSALGKHVVNTRNLDHFISFDDETGLLTCQAGVSLDEILKVFVPQGWFLPVTPGTKFITVGGAIASDVHGKNHHVEGTFADHVRSLKIMVGDGQILEASPKINRDLFIASCGGMGLTGLIVEATFNLKKIASSNIVETTYKCSNLDEVIARFEETKDATYSVAWIDCLATGNKLGRSLLMVGEHAEIGPLEAHPDRAIPVPFDFPAFLMNKFTMSVFNWLYYNKALRKKHTRTIPYQPFFYPLDVARDWNRLYGKPGFIQYQFVLPFSSGVEGLREVLNLIAESGKGSMLAVLKIFGEENDNVLSFPTAGFTLALDFKVEESIFPLLEQLDAAVLKHDGRLYLTKDSRMSVKTFKQSYPRWEEFENTRVQYGVNGLYTSRQAQRLGLA